MSEVPMAGTGFLPHATCLLGDQRLIWLMVISDGALTLAYLGISAWLVYFVKKRKDLPFNWIFFMLQGVFLGCGAGHLARIWTLWHPDYWMAGYVDAATAALSFPTAILLFQLLPKALAVPSTAQLAAANRDLEEEIAERKEVEAALKGYKNHLEDLVAQRTREVKDFAYIASHDLKAPLRGISQLASWLHDDYGEVLDEGGKKKCTLLMERTLHMHNMIEGILDYSRVGRDNIEPQAVDTGKVVNEIIDSIAPPSHIAFAMGEKMPVVIMDRVQLVQVFQNLISNAIKYIDKPQGLVEIGFREFDLSWEFFVKDNGPGIEERHFERIFMIFQTLNGHGGMESTGIGLTIVKKIVESNEGSVWVESQVGEGSTFWFAVPKKLRGEGRPVPDGKGGENAQ